MPVLQESGKEGSHLFHLICLRSLRQVHFFGLGAREVFVRLGHHVVLVLGLTNCHHIQQAL